MSFLPGTIRKDPAAGFLGPAGRWKLKSPLYLLLVHFLLPSSGHRRLASAAEAGALGCRYRVGRWSSQGQILRSRAGQGCPQGASWALLLMPCVTWRRAARLSGPQFPHQYNEGLVEVVCMGLGSMGYIALRQR